MVCCIYLLTNQDGYGYIGKTKNLQRRLNTHNSKYNQTMSKLLGDDKECIILEECDEDCLDDYEKYYFDMYKELYGDKILNKMRPLQTRKEWTNINREKIVEQNRQYRKENREIISNNNKTYNQLNRKKISEQKREYRKVNSEKISAQKREYYLATRDKLRQQHREYYIANREKTLQRQRSKQLKDIPDK